MYKVGDKVKVVAMEEGHGLDIGSVHMIDGIEPCWDRAIIKGWSLIHSEIELIEEPTKQSGYCNTYGGGDEATSYATTSSSFKQRPFPATIQGGEIPALLSGVSRSAIKKVEDQKIKERQEDQKLLDKFARAALSAIPDLIERSDSRISEECYNVAEAMMNERKKRMSNE